MKELISDPYKPRYDQPQAYVKKTDINPPPYEPEPQKVMPIEPKRQNYIMNERELQKNKLQNQKH